MSSRAEQRRCQQHAHDEGDERLREPARRDVATDRALCLSAFEQFAERRCDVLLELLGVRLARARGRARRSSPRCRRARGRPGRFPRGPAPRRAAPTRDARRHPMTAQLARARRAAPAGSGSSGRPSPARRRRRRRRRSCSPARRAAARTRAAASRIALETRCWRLGAEVRHRCLTVSLAIATMGHHCLIMSQHRRLSRRRGRRENATETRIHRSHWRRAAAIVAGMTIAPAASAAGSTTNLDAVPVEGTIPSTGGTFDGYGVDINRVAVQNGRLHGDRHVDRRRRERGRRHGRIGDRQAGQPAGRRRRTARARSSTCRSGRSTWTCSGWSFSSIRCT